MNADETIKVWDLPTRLFHWTLASAFLIAYLTEDDLLGLHTFAGYTIIGLLAFRLIWGVIGSRHARFTDFVKRPAVVLAYLKEVVAFRAKRYIGHNPAGGAMVLALLLSLGLTALSGLMTYGSEELAGPLASFMRDLPQSIGNLAEDVHEFFANFTLLLVVLHVAGVAIASLQHGENLARSMVTGRKHPE
jgi:cytochrome b